jgi:hypothetical protein
VDLVDEQYVAWFEVGQKRRQIPGSLEHRSRRLPQIHLELVGDDVGERGLTQSRRPEYQDVIECFAALSCGLNEDLHLVLDVGLANVVGERLGAHGTVRDLVVTAAGPCNDAILLDSHTLRLDCGLQGPSDDLGG